MGTRRQFLKTAGYSAAAGAMTLACSGARVEQHASRPNILFCIADDWGWPHAGKYGDRTVQTPAFERLANEGILFHHSYVSSPSCTPSRNSILTGQHHWRLGEGANLYSTLDTHIPVYPLLLEQAGYHVGFWRKSWGPGMLEPGGYVDSHPAGKQYGGGFGEFLDARPEGTPFCFWLGASDPHRTYEEGSGRASGIDVDAVEVPGFLPDVEPVRSDIADYYFEVQRFDSDVAAAVSLLEEIGELDNTLIVMTGDNGMPFPRCKSNIYDMGVHEPLAIRWGDVVKGGREVYDFTSFADFAPTFLAAAGVRIPETMSGRSLLPILESDKNGWIMPERDHVLFGKERHTPAQRSPSMGGYPCRGIRTDDYLYIYNFAPDRWPAGVPEGATHPIGIFADCDDGPSKTFLMEHKDDPVYSRYYELSFGKRPAEELYDMKNDPDQLNNLAGDSRYEVVRSEMNGRLMNGLRETGDPRVIGGGEVFDNAPFRATYELNR